ncbi:DNA-3-methyladenine glycosylase I [Microvirga sp. W0021]|uniref:DNA-3-methyladenine glycosylase I n=1 Tax=Hohaiivirga grylli TaxID=3133970 RepID=A0ABV0BL40_9HYPH
MSDEWIILHEDGKTRCAWPGVDPLYVAYHDEEWGVPEFDDRALFEKLILDGFQAGLSWITILRKRDNFRKAFAGFEPEKIIHFDDAKVEELMQDTGIVRNRLKITSTIASAKAYLEIQEKQGFSNYLWDFLDGRPIQNQLRTRDDVLAETELSKKISKDLRKKGFNFCGPTIVYAFMQAVGMVNDHMVSCFRHEECAELARKL